MARLFVTSKEISYFNDIYKELVKDIIGQKIRYYSVSILNTKVHDVYNEADEKIFDNPIDIDALVSSNKWEASENEFGSEKQNTLEVFIQARDLIDKQINLSAGDFFEYGGEGYEITSVLQQNYIFGQPEYLTSYKLTAKLSRTTLFAMHTLQPPTVDTNDLYADKEGIQKSFVQQRGFAENSEGITGDVRELQLNGVLDPPILGPIVVTPKPSSSSEDDTFYEDEI